MSTQKTQKGMVHVKAKLAERGSEEPIHEEESNEKTKPQTGEHLAMVRGGTFVRLSRNFQSMEIQVGVEMPWPVRPGHPEDLAGAFDAIDEIIEDRASKKIGEMEEVLRTLKK